MRLVVLNTTLDSSAHLKVGFLPQKRVLSPTALSLHKATVVEARTFQHQIGTVNDVCNDVMKIREYMFR